jgi:pimeloyl-ACP methyl ester carboxylesterase
MPMNAEASASSIAINGAHIELIERDRGRPILFLHPHIGLDPAAPVLDLLAAGGRLIAPSHPGFGHSERPAGITTVDDLAYFYLDLMDALDLSDAVGVSFGAWIAASIAVKTTVRMRCLVLANPVGIKVGDRETRDILDIFAMLEDEFLDKAFADPAAGRRDYSAASADEVMIAARNREAAGLYAWSPYMHDPKLKGRLHRISVPTLVLWGEADRLIGQGYGRAYCAAIPGALRDHRGRRPFCSYRAAEGVCRACAGICQCGTGNELGGRSMRVYQFTEQPYFPAWSDHDGSLRVNLPNAKQDPKRAADLLHRYYDEFRVADEVGLDIMVNEHHSTATCMSCTSIVALSVLARETRRARLLVLGYPIGHRPDPLRCAEELATIDVISRGRLDMGFIKGVP